MAAASSKWLCVLAHPIPLHRCYHASLPSRSLPFTRWQRSYSRAPASLPSRSLPFTRWQRSYCRAPALAGAGGCGRGSGSVAAKGAKKKTSDDHLKRRTRSGEAFDRDQYKRYADPASGHVPVMLGEVLQAFRLARLVSFVDCTLGAAGHSAAATLMAEDILNAWPEDEVGRVLRDFGEESNWRYLQKKIVSARTAGGLHSTGELVNLVRHTTSGSGGRQGWIKTATRVFQALRIAVNDELQTLQDALYACYDCLSSGGRLAVISFHSLEDRIVKQTFLDIIEGDEQEKFVARKEEKTGVEEVGTWSKQRIQGRNGIILTKRPITPSEEEERLNRRCRSAKLRVIQKL